MELLEKISPLLSDPVFVSIMFIVFGFISGWCMCLFCHVIGAAGDVIMDLSWRLTHKKTAQEKEAP